MHTDIRNICSISIDKHVFLYYDELYKKNACSRTYICMYGGENYEGNQEKGKKTEGKQSKAFRDWFFSFGDNIDFFGTGSSHSQCRDF